MIHVFYTVFNNKLPIEIWNYWANQLTPAMQQQLVKYKNWQDAQRGLLGKALLIRGCQKLNFQNVSLQQLATTKYQKPYFLSGPAFNISHSGNVVVCAISNTNIIGIDVEEIKPIPLDDFSDLFSDAELQMITENENDYKAFYKLWTQKEAFVKALGVGLSLPLRELDVDNGSISYEGSRWFLTQIPLQNGYVCNLASNTPNADWIVEKLEFKRL